MEILLVDDEHMILNALRDCVEEIFPKAQIDIFKDGLPAWEAASRKKYDLVITDIIMRQMNGDELARHIHGIHPDTHILFETADLKSNLIRRGIQPERCIFKPFDVESIRQKTDRLYELPPFSIELPEKKNQGGISKTDEAKDKQPKFWQRLFGKITVKKNTKE